MSGRLISDNIIIAHEMVHGLRTNQKVSEECMAIKTDMSKAYDRVEWNFLEVLLEKMGFERTWVKWIMACVTTVSFSVLLNGNSHGFIKPERGLRQGDPLSPFLFILCAEALVSCLNASEEAGRLHGIKLSASAPAVHHLLFADDSLLLCKANILEATEVLTCLKEYGDASGQMINLQKSSIIFGSKVPHDAKEEIKGILGIDQEGGEGSYLGLPECFSGSKVKMLNFLKEKLQGRLRGWFSKSLSQGGKEILLKSVALALPIYAMSCFRLPKDVCAKLTSAMVEFWWSSGNNKKKIPWVAWQKLCKDKELGGLGFKDIEKFNQALLAKQAWRIWSNPESLVARILKHRYFARTDFLECSIGTRPSFAWRSIIHGRELLSQGLYHKIGSGETTRLWSDNWLVDGRARPPMYRQDAIVDLTLTVSDLIDSRVGSWSVPRIRELIVEEDVERVLQTPIDLARQDQKMWGFSRNGIYNSKSGYKLAETLQEMQLPPSPGLPPIEKRLWKDLWQTNTSPKIKHFMWRALSGALAVKSRLQSRGILLDTTCSRCGLSEETICHVLFHCEVAKKVWTRSGFPMPSGGFSVNSVWLNFYHLMSVSRKLPKENEARLAFPWILWQIWKARNSFCFEQWTKDAELIFSKASNEATMWLNMSLISGDGPSSQMTNLEARSKWQKPPPGITKCNVASSWVDPMLKGGAAWIARSHTGIPLVHSRSALLPMSSSFEAGLCTLLRACTDMHNLHFKKVIFEISSPLVLDAINNPRLFSNVPILLSSTLCSLHQFDYCQVVLVPEGVNSLAFEIAASVTTGLRYQSYIANGGPSWLSPAIRNQALP